MISLTLCELLPEAVSEILVEIFRKVINQADAFAFLPKVSIFAPIFDVCFDSCVLEQSKTSGYL